MNVRVLIQTMLMTAVMLFGLTTISAQEASAQDVRVVVRSIEASKGGEYMDPKLNDLKKQLNQPGFAGYSSFKQVDSKSFTLSKGASKSLALKNGKEAKLTFHGHAKDLAKVGLEIVGRMNTTLRLSKGSYFFQAGMRYGKGILILAIKIDG